MNLHTSSLSSLDNGYTFPFFRTNPFFVLMAWSYNFLMGIISLVFLLKTWIHLWNLFDTSCFTSSSNFAISFLSYIFYSSATFFISIIFSFFGFFLFLSFLFLFFLLLPLFLPFSSFFCFSHPNFPYFGLHCFSHSSRHLVIFTSLVLQSISGLWWVNYDISKIILHFYPLIISISVFSLYP